MSKQRAPMLRHTLNFLSVGGVNPTLGNRFHLRDIFSTTTLISVVFLICLMVTEIITTWSGVKSLRLAIFLPGWGMAIIKQILLMKNRKRLNEMVNTLETFWISSKFGDDIEKAVKKIYARAYRYIKSFGCFVVFNCVVILVPVILSEERMTIYVNYRLCDLRDDLCYAAYSIWHLFAVITILPASIGFDMLFIVFVAYVYAALEMVKAAFVKMNLPEKIELQAEKLREIVDQHNIILQFLRNFNHFLALILMLQFSISMWQLVVCWFMLTFHGLPPDAEAISQYGLFAVTLMFQLLIYSIGGALIYDQVLSVGDAAFTVDWFLKGQTNLRKDLSFIIHRTQKVSRLSIGFIYNLSLPFFVSTLRQSLSIFTLLRTISIKAGALESFG